MLVLFLSMVSHFVGWQEKSYSGYISETVRYRKFIIGGDIGWWGDCRYVLSWCNLDLTFGIT